MVRLSKIYTRTGDRGQTRLGDMSQVPKTSDRIEAYGSVDELNSVIGLVRTVGAEWDGILGRVQNDLFDVGADLCVPVDETAADSERLRLRAVQVDFLERQIDQINGELKPLDSFVLPGGTPLAAWLHLARTVCRRAERQVWRLAEGEAVGQTVPEYLNRLSDLLFVMARAANKGGAADVLWRPGAGAEESQKKEE